MTDEKSDFNEDKLYDLFPAGDADGFGPDEGFDTWVRLNDKKLFTDEALANPAIRAFVEAPFAVTFGQFKSSHRETEYLLHKPHLAMTGNVRGLKDGMQGIVGVVEGISPDDPRTPISTMAFNHERTLAAHITRSIVISDGGTAGQIIHKEPKP